MSGSILISINEACRRTSLSRTQINIYRSRGLFPEKVDVGTKRIAFVSDEVDQWIASRIAARNGEASR